MEDKDNQQQTVSDFEIGWAAGIIEGEGSICLQIHKRNTTRSQQMRITPRVIVTNTDKLIIEKYVSILDRLGIGKWVRHTRPNNVSSLLKLGGKEKPKFKDITYVHVEGMKRTYKLLGLLIPSMFGEKKERALILNRFIKGRLEKNPDKGPKNYSYDDTDIETALEFLRLTNTPNYKKIEGMLNEYTREARDQKRREYKKKYAVENREHENEMRRARRNWSRCTLDSCESMRERRNDAPPA